MGSGIKMDFPILKDDHLRKADIYIFSPARA